MATIPIQITSIFDGFMPSALFGGKQEYLTGIGIDPDYPLTDLSTDLKASGSIRPVAYSAFSGAAVTSFPIAILTTPKNNKIYAVLSNGRLISYSSSFGSETLIGTVASASAVGHGAFYYNNYIYIIGDTDIARYGPLDGAPALTNSVWTGATLGSQTALTDNAYPANLLSVGYINHHGIVHIDNNAYFLDYKNGQGLIHAIKTKKTTAEGDTNDGSVYGVLKLPFNYLPITIQSYGNNIVVAASFTTDGTVKQGKAALFFFNPADTVSSFYQVCYLPDAICSALWYENGHLYGISGDLNGGYRLFQSGGGATITTLKYIEEGNPPMQMAISAIAERLVWAADTTFPLTASGLFGYGSKSGLFPKGLHHIAISPLT